MKSAPENKAINLRRYQIAYCPGTVESSKLFSQVIVSLILLLGVYVNLAAAQTTSNGVHRSDNLNSLLSETEVEYLQANPIIRVNNESGWPPYNFAKDETPQGYSIDYMNLLAQKAGLNIEYVTGPSWNQFLAMMKEGALDVMLNIVKTPEREISFPHPFILHRGANHMLISLYWHSSC